MTLPAFVVTEKKALHTGALILPSGNNKFRMLLHALIDAEYRLLWAVHTSKQENTAITTENRGPVASADKTGFVTQHSGINRTKTIDPLPLHDSSGIQCILNRCFVCGLKPRLFIKKQ